MKKDYYDILGVPRNASKEEIKKAFYKLAHQYHPDASNNATEAVKRLAEEKFKEINEAYSVLYANKSRIQYDQTPNYSQSEYSESKEKTEGVDLKKTYNYIRYGVVFVVVTLVIIGIFSGENNNDSTNPTNLSGTNSGQEITTVPFSNSFKNQNEKCVVEDRDLKICDLSFSSFPYTQDYRDISTEGNSVACVNMTTGETSQGEVGKLRATTNPAFCVTDWGHLYIDPTLKVTKHYKTISRDDYNSPYKVPQVYDTCLWSYSDGNGSIPYIEVLSSVGPRSGYDEKAFCVNGQSQVDIYTGQN